MTIIHRRNSALGKKKSTRKKTNMVNETKVLSTHVQTMEELVKLFNKVIVQHYIDEEIRVKKEEEQWEKDKAEREGKREAWRKKKEEKEAKKKQEEEEKKKEKEQQPVTSVPSEGDAAASKKESEVDKRKKDQKAQQGEEEDEGAVPDESEYDKHREFLKKRALPPRSNFEMRKQLFKLVKTLVATSINSEPSRIIAPSPYLDEVLSVAYEYLAIFRDVGMAVVICSFACNLCAHLGVRPLIDATALVSWFLDISLLFNSLKRVVHLCLLGIGNAAMCRDCRLNDEMTREFAATVCRLPGEARVIEAWSCAIINLVGTSKSGNGSMLLKHDIFSMLQRLVVIHGTEEQTAARGMQAMTCLSLVHFPGKQIVNSGTSNNSAASSVSGSPTVKLPGGASPAAASS